MLSYTQTHAELCDHADDCEFIDEDLHKEHLRLPSSSCYHWCPKISCCFYSASCYQCWDLHFSERRFLVALISRLWWSRILYKSKPRCWRDEHVHSRIFSRALSISSRTTESVIFNSLTADSKISNRNLVKPDISLLDYYQVTLNSVGTFYFYSSLLNFQTNMLTRREFLREILYKNMAIIAIMNFVDTSGDFSHTIWWNSLKSAW